MPKLKKQPPEKTELELLYLKEGTTISSAARHYGVNNPTLRNWLNLYGIPKKDHKQASTEANNRRRNDIKPSKIDLENLYNISTIKDLESYFGVGQQTIYEWLNSYDIPIRSLNDSCKMGKQKQFHDIQFSKEYLEEQYERDKPISELADKIGVSRNHILKLFAVHGIERSKLDPPWRSKAEIELFDFLRSEFPEDDWECSNKTLINPFELDIVNHTKRIAVEYCGLYWHAEYSSGKDKLYHRRKFDLCENKGYKLITVFESDNIQKVKQLLLKLNGKTKRIFARNTITKKLDSKTASEFHSKYHIHGHVGGSHHFGLFYQDELVMAISFGKNRFGKQYEYECSRLTTNDSLTVVGGVSKLFKKFIDEVGPSSIVTFADLRFGNGKSYLNCGFTEEDKTHPNYWYFKKNTTKIFSRVKFQKHKLSSTLETFDPEKTEFENMIENNWDRIWDCGNAKYTWFNKKGED